MSRESRVDDRPGLRTQRAKSASTFKQDSFRRTWKYNLNPNPQDFGSWFSQGLCACELVFCRLSGAERKTKISRYAEERIFSEAGNEVLREARHSQGAKFIRPHFRREIILYRKSYGRSVVRVPQVHNTVTTPPQDDI